MISVQQQQKQFAVRGQDDAGKTVLALPLHRLFLRGVVMGTEAEDACSWLIPTGTRPVDVLHSILDHFKKYGIECVFDLQCQAILEAEEKQRQRYEGLLYAGAKAKKNQLARKAPDVERCLRDGFTRRPTEFQLAAIRHLLAVENGANFSVPGSGKTTIALAYFHILRKQELVNGLLVIGPASCFGPWEQEFKICFGQKPMSVRLAGNTQRRRRELLALSGRNEVLLTTYHSAARDLIELEKLLARRPFLVILDESHYVKRPQGGKLAEAVLSLSRFAQRRVILTGTPMPNGLADLWSQITFLWPEQRPLGSSDDYLREIQRQDQSTVLSGVRERIAPLFFRITKRQLHLPRPTFRLLRYAMSPLQRRIYVGVAARFLRQTVEAPKDRDSLREWRRARAIRLLQIAANPALLRRRCDEFRLPPLDLKGVALRDAIDHYADYEIPHKVALACGLVRDLCSSGNKVLVWSSFVHNLTMLAKHLQEFNPVVVFGEVPYLTADSDEFNREGLIRRFQEDKACRVLIANPAACAESISLHMVCHHAVYLDRSFNCAHYLQSLDRIHRLGLPDSTNTVYYLLISADSIDEIVHARLKAKLRLMQSVVENDLPGSMPGYWSEDLGDEEAVDLALVEEHIKRVVSGNAHQTQ